MTATGSSVLAARFANPDAATQARYALFRMLGKVKTDADERGFYHFTWPQSGYAAIAGRTGRTFMLWLAPDREGVERLLGSPNARELRDKYPGYWANDWIPENEFGHWDGLHAAVVKPLAGERRVQPTSVRERVRTKLEGTARDAVNSVLAHVREESQRLRTLARVTREAASILASVPSRAPMRTAINSGFGMRSDPFTGTPTFHAGIDFAASTGTVFSSPRRFTVSVVGSPAALTNVSFVDTEPVDVSNLSSSVVRRVQVVPPTGLTLLQPQPISLTIRVTPLTVSQTLRVGPTLQGLGSGLEIVGDAEEIDIRYRCALEHSPWKEHGGDGGQRVPAEDRR